MYIPFKLACNTHGHSEQLARLFWPRRKRRESALHRCLTQMMFNCIMVGCWRLLWRCATYTYVFKDLTWCSPSVGNVMKAMMVVIVVAIDVAMVWWLDGVLIMMIVFCWRFDFFTLWWVCWNVASMAVIRCFHGIVKHEDDCDDDVENMWGVAKITS